MRTAIYPLRQFSSIAQGPPLQIARTRLSTRKGLGAFKYRLEYLIYDIKSWIHRSTSLRISFKLYPVTVLYCTLHTLHANKNRLELNKLLYVYLYRDIIDLIHRYIIIHKFKLPLKNLESLCKVREVKINVGKYE